MIADPASWRETATAIAVGIGLAAACGFRVFVPLFVMGLAGATGHLTLAHDAAWAASTPALVALGTATALEVGAYYVPWLDHALDAVATPAALLAGIGASAAVLTDLPPLLRWGTAVVAGGGAAGLVQGATVLLRAKSGLLTGGLGNPAVATAELGGAIGLALLALAVPLAALIVTATLIVWVVRRTGRRLIGRRPAVQADSSRSS